MVRKFTVTDLRNLYNKHFYDKISREDTPGRIDIIFERFFDWLDNVYLDELR